MKAPTRSREQRRGEYFCDPTEYYEVVWVVEYSLFGEGFDRREEFSVEADALERMRVMGPSAYEIKLIRVERL